MLEQKTLRVQKKENGKRFEMRATKAIFVFSRAGLKKKFKILRELVGLHAEHYRRIFLFKEIPSG
jgi:hypothetical protein